MSYSQKPSNLQTATVDYIAFDEELPMTIYDEIMFRLARSNGYISGVFTATLGQDFWWRAMEAIGTDMEELKDAFKQQVSMYECVKYANGTASPWTIEKIKGIEANCKNKAEILRRVYGRFVREDGRKYHAFDPARHYKKPKNIPKSWHFFSGVDIGSGGAKNHPSAIVMVAVRPDYKLGYVYKGWRGDKIETTAGDVLDKYREMKKGKSFTLQKYDFAAKDFGTIASRQGESFTPAEKNHKKGEEVINTLFKNNMLFVFDDESGEGRKLGSELIQLNTNTPKTKAKDDFADALRYAVVNIPWDFEALKLGEVISEDYSPKNKAENAYKRMSSEEIKAMRIKQRRGEFVTEHEDGNSGWVDEFDQEISFWNSQY